MKHTFANGDQDVLMGLLGSIPVGMLSVDDFDAVCSIRAKVRSASREVELTDNEHSFLIARMRKLHLIDLLARLENPKSQEYPPVVVDISGNAR